MTELDTTTYAEITESPPTSKDEYCHIVMEASDVAYCGHTDNRPVTCKPYAGEAVCPSCGLATCPTCAVMASLNDRLEYS